MFILKKPERRILYFYYINCTDLVSKKRGFKHNNFLNFNFDTYFEIKQEKVSNKKVLYY